MTRLPSNVIAVGMHHARVVAALSELCLEDAWSDAAVGSFLATPGAFGLMAVEAERPAAFILCRAAGGECEVLAVGVLPESRRRGMAIKLIDAALGQASAQDARRVFLEVAEDNLAARGLYARCGFSMVGRRPRYYRRPCGEHADALVLARSQDLQNTVQSGESNRRG